MGTVIPILDERYHSRRGFMALMLLIRSSTGENVGEIVLKIKPKKIVTEPYGIGSMVLALLDQGFVQFFRPQACL